MRGILRVLPITAIAALVAVGAAHAAPPELTPSPLLVRAGEAIAVTGPACPAGHTVTYVLQQTLGPNFAKGVPPFVPLDESAIGLVDTAQGISFTATAASARTTLNFRVDCSDGSSMLSPEPVTVQPPPGEFWWLYNTLDGSYVTEPGALLSFITRTWECPAGATATGTIVAANGSTVVGPLSTTVGSDATIEFGIELPATFNPGEYTGTISCAGPSGAISNSTPILVSGGFPGTGSSHVLILLSAVTLALGLVLQVGARRRSINFRAGLRSP